jgi:glycosyltransferase involved in cell wall biosynthesis
MPRKVLYILTGAGVGGLERQLLMVIDGLDPGRYVAEVLLVRGGALEHEYTRRAPTTIVDKRGKVDPLFLARLVRAIRTSRADVVHTWGSTANLWGGVAARLAGAEHLVVSDGALEEWKGRVLRAGDRLVGRWADRVVGNSAAVAAASIERGAPAQRTRVVDNAVLLPPEPDDSRREQGLVVLLGRFDERKGHEVLVDALPAVVARVPAVRVVLAGPAVRAEEVAVRARVVARLAQLGLTDRVELPGAVDGPAELLGRAAVCVVPSTSEGMPNVLLEAIAHGAAVVATSVGGIPEVVTDGATGWLVPPNRPAELAEALSAALTDPAGAARRAAAAREMVERRFHPDVVMAAWMALYDDVVAAPALGGRRPARWYRRSP